MSEAREGDKVIIHYTGSLKDGHVFDTTVTNGPVIFTIGEGVEVPGIEKAVVGMKKGEVKSVQVPPEDAYGQHKNNLVSVVERTKLSGNIDLKLGMKLKARTSTGIMKDVTVCNITDSSITVDANHPLAGKELRYEITLVDIIKE